MQPTVTTVLTTWRIPGLFYITNTVKAPFSRGIISIMPEVIEVQAMSRTSIGLSAITYAHCFGIDCIVGEIIQSLDK